MEWKTEELAMEVVAPFASAMVAIAPPDGEASITGAQTKCQEIEHREGDGRTAQELEPKFKAIGQKALLKDKIRKNLLETQTQRRGHYTNLKLQTPERHSDPFCKLRTHSCKPAPVQYGSLLTTCCHLPTLLGP